MTSSSHQADPDCALLRLPPFTTPPTISRHPTPQNTRRIVATDRTRPGCSNDVSSATRRLIERQHGPCVQHRAHTDLRPGPTYGRIGTMQGAECGLKAKSFNKAFVFLDDQLGVSSQPSTGVTVALGETHTRTTGRWPCSRP